MSEQYRRRPLPRFDDQRAWDVRTVDGQLALTVPALAAALGISRADAREWVQANATVRALPDELIADAQLPH
ncbi:hypothetical protein [Prescottella agglutinans]|uniref:Uncharacterized protein n=1 Tax=Prescottella agglutinans TaxID=1644129 RepID=A0ABT6MI63_9NOCA|nr:hypothetical protein [Prescottella agglutinans]MDH6283987.1 hypothetical protein [Prescottella agglutinans]